MPIDPTHQLIILARLSEFCQYRSHAWQDSDPWSFMRRKLQETEAPLSKMKRELLDATTGKLLQEIKAGPLDGERCADFKTLFERLVAPGDFADIAIHLEPGQDPKHLTEMLTDVLRLIKPHHLFIEEAKPPERRSPSWEKLVRELRGRIGIDQLDAAMSRDGKSARRRAYVLRRLRRNVAEYCTVVRIPKDPNDTLTPFMLPRIEGLIAACLRFLDNHR